MPIPRKMIESNLEEEDACVDESHSSGWEGELFVKLGSNLKLLPVLFFSFFPFLTASIEIGSAL